MIFQSINIHHLRSISQAKYTFHPRFNYIIGANASGKTTLLESLALISNGHSFKTRESLPLIQQGQNQFTIFAQSDETTISLSKSLDAATLMKINGQTCQTTSQLAYLSPCQVYYQDLFEIMDAGPAIRRMVLDWGMFHVKHDYLSVWKQYRQCLRQRNSLLKQKPKKDLMLPWDELLAGLGEKINDMRFSYIEQLKNEYATTLEKLCDIEIRLNYYKGWDKKGSGISLLNALSQNYEKDMLRGFTSIGIHQADLLIESHDSQAKKILSRGQQKMALIALKLSQCSLLKQHAIHLLDDIFAELDERHLGKLAKHISDSQDQFFLSGLSSDEFKLSIFPVGEKIYL